MIGICLALIPVCFILMFIMKLDYVLFLHWWIDINYGTNVGKDHHLYEHDYDDGYDYD